MKRSLALLLPLAFAFSCGGANAAGTDSSAESVKAEAHAKQGKAVPALDAKAQSALTPDAVLTMLQQGNARFLAGQSLHRNYMEQVAATSAGQYPAAVVLSCIDSRAPAELLFDQGVGDIFNIRVAGNFINPDNLGSMEFATKVAGAKLVVVMGHTACGAVKGSCDNVQLGHVSSLVNTIQPSVQAVTPEGQTCSSKDEQLVDKIATHNVQRTISEIRERSSIIAELENSGAIKIVGAMYDVATGQVQFM